MRMGNTTAVNERIVDDYIKELKRHEFWLETDNREVSLTRSEYRQLLLAAIQMNRERIYLIIKLFACTGITQSQIPDLTVQAVRDGGVWFSSGSIHIPPCLCEELLSYAIRRGICEGSVFFTRSGRGEEHGNIAREIRSVAVTANVSEEKCTPEFLRKLYFKTQFIIRKDIEAFAERVTDRIIEREQVFIGWMQ